MWATFTYDLPNYFASEDLLIGIHSQFEIYLKKFQFIFKTINLIYLIKKFQPKRPISVFMYRRDRPYLPKANLLPLNRYDCKNTRPPNKAALQTLSPNY